MVIRIITGGPSLTPPNPKIQEKKREKKKKKKDCMKLGGEIHYQSGFYSFCLALIDCMGCNLKFAIAGAK